MATACPKEPRLLQADLLHPGPDLDSYGAAALTGTSDLRQGRYSQAVDRLRQALPIHRQLGDKANEVRVINHLGEAALHMGRPVDAHAWHAAALERASQIGTKHEQADAHNGMARGYYATGDLREARRHWRQAPAIYTDIGAPEVAQVRAQLATVETERGNRLLVLLPRTICGSTGQATDRATWLRTPVLAS